MTAQTHSFSDTQYCDGLGPFIVYDPDDPNKHLYDIDDGAPYFNVPLNKPNEAIE